MQRSEGALYRNVRRRRGAGQGSGFGPCSPSGFSTAIPMGYLLSFIRKVVVLEPCQPQPPLAPFKIFTFRNSVLGLMPSSFAAF